MMDYIRRQTDRQVKDVVIHSENQFGDDAQGKASHLEDGHTGSLFVKNKLVAKSACK